LSEPIFVRPGYVDLLGRPIHRIPTIGRAERGHDEYAEWLRRGLPSDIVPTTVYGDRLLADDPETYETARKSAGLDPRGFVWNNPPEATETFLRAYFRSEDLCLVRILKHSPEHAMPVWAFQVVQRKALSR
jgi:hypothetical protein